MDVQYRRFLAAAFQSVVSRFHVTLSRSRPLGMAPHDRVSCRFLCRAFLCARVTCTHPSLPCSTSASPTVQSACDCHPIVPASSTVRCSSGRRGASVVLAGENLNDGEFFIFKGNHFTMAIEHCCGTWIAPKTPTTAFFSWQAVAEEDVPLSSRPGVPASFVAQSMAFTYFTLQMFSQLGDNPEADRIEQFLKNVLDGHLPISVSITGDCLCGEHDPLVKTELSFEADGRHLTNLIITSEGLDPAHELFMQHAVVSFSVFYEAIMGDLVRNTNPVGPMFFIYLCKAVAHLRSKAISSPQKHVNQTHEILKFAVRSHERWLEQDSP